LGGAELKRRLDAALQHSANVPPWPFGKQRGREFSYLMYALATMSQAKGVNESNSFSSRRIAPAYWIALSFVCLIIDYLTGPFIEFPVVYLVPISLASWFEGRRWGMALAFTLPLFRLYFRTVWDPPWTFLDSLINAAIRISVFASFAWLIDRTARQMRQLRLMRLLEGMLGVCGVCKSIRDDSLDAWQSLDSYVQAHPDEFRPDLCPKCAKHVRQVVDRR
jgi:hypothetical protein